MSIKIIKDLGDNRYEVEIPPREKTCFRESGFGLAHDYAYFEDWVYFQKENGCVSDVKVWSSFHIPIREFVNICLPWLNKHKYAQPEHLQDRVHTEDDQYWNSEWQKGEFKEPRFKKGDKYPAYAYNNTATFFWDEESKTRKVAVRMDGEADFTIMSVKMYNLLKDKL